MSRSDPGRRRQLRHSASAPGHLRLAAATAILLLATGAWTAVAFAPSAEASTTIAAAGDGALWQYIATPSGTGWRAESAANDGSAASGIEQLVGAPSTTAYAGWTRSTGGDSLLFAVSLVSQRTTPELRQQVRRALDGACSGVTGAEPVSITRQPRIQSASQAECAAFAGSTGASAADPGSAYAIAWSRADVIVTVVSIGLPDTTALAEAEVQNRTISPTGIPTGSHSLLVGVGVAGAILLGVIALALLVVRSRSTNGR